MHDSGSADSPKSGRDLLPEVYEELRRLARSNLAKEPPGQTLQATALVHEAYLRLGGDGSNGWDNKGHFFGAAAEAMRRILVDNARKKLRRPRHLQRENGKGQVDASAKDRGIDVILDIDQALRQLEHESPKRAAVVKLKFFAGCTLDEIAEYLDMARSTVAEHWKYAKAWLSRRMRSLRDDAEKKDPPHPDSRIHSDA